MTNWFNPSRKTKWTLPCGHSLWDWSHWYQRCLKCFPVRKLLPILLLLALASPATAATDLSRAPACLPEPPQWLWRVGCCADSLFWAWGDVCRDHMLQRARWHGARVLPDLWRWITNQETVGEI